LRDRSLFSSLCAVLLFLAMLTPIGSAAVVIVNASYDGSVGTGADANWTWMRNDAAGDSHLNLFNKVYGGVTVGNPNLTDIYDEHWRGLVTFDTSPLPDDATITSATISVHGAGKNNELGTVNFCIIDAEPANQLNFVDTDYHRTTFTRFAADTSYDSYNIHDWNTIPLNSLGLTNISKTGYTTFMFTHSADVDNTNLTWKEGLDYPDLEPQSSAFQFNGSAFVDATKPYLTINYETSAVTPPVASFNLNVTSGTAPLTVKFTDTSANSPTSWHWSFGDGTWYNTTVSAERNATHVYLTPNSYTAKLTVTNTGGSDTTSPGTTITVNATPVVSPMDKIGIYQSGTWYLDNSGNGAWGAGDSVYSFGGAFGYTPVTGDWNASGKSYIGVTNGQQWYLDWNGNGAWDVADKAYSFGTPGWQNVTGDWNHDGKTDIGITNGQQWYLDMNNNGVYESGVDKAYSFGAPGWTPVVGDWNTTGNSYIGVTNGQQWYLDWNGNGAWDGADKAYSFGALGWITVIGDWNHDGKTDIGVTNGQQWYLDMNNNGVYDSGVDKAYSFGAPGWTPVVGDWNATGYTNVGVTNGQQWYLDMNNNGVYDSGVDKAYSFGAPGWTPVKGKWI
jgi:PKD repeat protein